MKNFLFVFFLTSKDVRMLTMFHIHTISFIFTLASLFPFSIRSKIIIL